MRSKLFLIRSAVILFSLTQVGFVCLLSSNAEDPIDCVDLSEDLQITVVQGHYLQLSGRINADQGAHVTMRANGKNASSFKELAGQNDAIKNKLYIDLNDIAVNGEYPETLTGVTWMGDCGGSATTIMGPTEVSTKP